jgi:hypothetical protein
MQEVQASGGENRKVREWSGRLRRNGMKWRISAAFNNDGKVNCCNTYNISTSIAHLPNTLGREVVKLAAADNPDVSASVVEYPSGSI